MRAKNVIGILFVLAIIVAAVAITQSLSQKGVGTEPKEKILVATMPLAAGTLLRAQDVNWQAVSETEPDQILFPSAAATETNPNAPDETRASVYGAVLRRSLAAGEPLRRSAYVKPGDREFLQVVLTPGARAIAIPVSTGGASTGLLSPGDHVDVILTQNFKNDNATEMRNTPVTRRSVSETIVDNLRVLAIDTPDPKATNTNPANGNFGRTVTVEVTAEQVEHINVAAELGKLSVALRSATGPTTLSATSQIDQGDPVIKPGQIVRPDQIAKPTNRVKPAWAGDVSPALYGAAQEKPVALTPPTVQVFHGAGKEGGSGGQQNVRSETVKTEN
jgi:pilus assembly protein CpaB